MSQALTITLPQKPPPNSQKPGWTSAVAARPELIVFAGILLILNAPMLVGSCWSSMTFEKALVLEGEWWRLLTHPFVHVSWYHLLLDATAFLTLYASLLDKSFIRRSSYIIAGAAGSLIVSCTAFTRPDQSLCGLSGIAHGLMAVSALEMITQSSADSATRRVGWFSFMLCVGKAAFEAITGKMFFQFLQFGLLGEPVAISHAGGIVGSITVWMWFKTQRRSAAEPQPNRQAQ